MKIRPHAKPRSRKGKKPNMKGVKIMKGMKMVKLNKNNDLIIFFFFSSC